MDFHSSNADSAVEQAEVVILTAEQLRRAGGQDDEAVGTLQVADGHSYFAAWLQCSTVCLGDFFL
jgi:hypothetical protein